MQECMSTHASRCLNPESLTTHLDGLLLLLAHMLQHCAGKCSSHTATAITARLSRCLDPKSGFQGSGARARNESASALAALLQVLPIRTKLKQWAI
eukprot:1161319-Pelagomonas_calceolata.AAC.16